VNTPHTRIKFCGVTDVADAMLAARLGVDAIGLVCTRRSPRVLTLAQAQAIRAQVPPYVSVVALFMDDEAAWVREVEAGLRPDLLQVHGAEPAAFCTAFATPYVKALAMADMADDVRMQAAAHPRAVGLLLDGHRSGEQGGRGQRFDWSRVPRDLDRPLIVAGGLDADNVGDVIRRVRPWAVDVASGIEASPGIKDPAKMHAFVAAVRATGSP
jgi:phosphoribosylanthranilate isomerase